VGTNPSQYCQKTALYVAEFEQMDILPRYTI